MTGNNPTLPLLSVCCLGYKHARFLEENVRSICAIDYPNIEIIAVDDGSQDNSVELLNRLAAEVPLKMTVIGQENTGNVGKNFNTALRQAQGELIAFIAMDDVFNPPVVLKQIQSMADNPKLLFNAATKMVSINDQGFISGNFTSPPAHDMEAPTVAALLDLEYSHFGGFYIQGCLFRKSLLDAVGGFDENQTGDDLVLRTKIFRHMLAERSEDFVLTKENACFYRLHDNNVHKNLGRQIKIVTEYLGKYWPERPLPDMLIDWMVNAIGLLGIEKSIDILAMNPVAASTLLHEKVQAALKRVATEKPKPVSWYKRCKHLLFKRIKDGDKRTLVFFSSLKFSYRKKSKPRPSENAVHYTDYR